MRISKRLNTVISKFVEDAELTCVITKIRDCGESLPFQLQIGTHAIVCVETSCEELLAYLVDKEIITEREARILRQIPASMIQLTVRESAR